MVFVNHAWPPPIALFPGAFQRESPGGGRLIPSSSYGLSFADCRGNAGIRLALRLPRPAHIHLIPRL